jgi:uncharacterized protein YbjT (DUF2867 family)
MILISGATGKTGGSVARSLVARGLKVRALVRNADKAAPLAAAGVELVSGDGADTAALAKAMAGVERAAVIYPNGPAQAQLERAFVDAARAAGVRHMVKLSSMEALPTMHNPVHQTHYMSEQHIKSCGMAWTMIRPNFFMQNFLGSAASIRAAGKFHLPMGKGRAAMTDTRDVAEVMALVLSATGHEGKVYEITGPEVMSFADVAASFSRVLGRKVEYVDAEPIAYKEHLGKFLSSSWHLDAVCDIFKEIRAGYETKTTGTFKQLLGRAPTSFDQFVADHRALFSNA